MNTDKRTIEEVKDQLADAVRQVNELEPLAENYKILLTYARAPEYAKPTLVIDLIKTAAHRQLIREAAEYVQAIVQLHERIEALEQRIRDATNIAHARQYTEGGRLQAVCVELEKALPQSSI